MNDLINIVPIRNQSLLISKKQKVNDIINEVLNSHAAFESDYLPLAEYFYNKNDLTIFKNIFNFCKQNLAYEIEPEEYQTTKSPGAILRTSNDCKHYASFIGGILNAINTKYGTKIKWKYRFGSYSLFNATPSHVFIVATDGESGKEYWIDPVLKSFNDRTITPYFYQDKKFKTKKMLTRISGISNNDFQAAIKYLAYKGIVTKTGLNKDLYIKVLESATPEEKKNLRNSFVIIKQGTERGTIGSFWDIVGKVLTTVGTAITPAPAVVPPPPPAPAQSSLDKYLPFILLGGVGIFAFIELQK